MIDAIREVTGIDFNQITTDEEAVKLAVDVNSGLCFKSIPSFLNNLPISYTLSNPPTISL